MIFLASEKGIPTGLSLFVISCIFCIGCQSPGHDNWKFVNTNYQANLRNAYSPPTAANPAPPWLNVTDPTLRNDEIRDLFAMIDVEYADYEKTISSASSWSAVGKSVAIITLNSIGALTGGTAVKAGLAAASAGIEGVSGAISKEVLYNESVQAITAQMRADRESIKAYIYGKMFQQETAAKTPTAITDYPMKEAWLDLQRYAKAGTFQNAVDSILDQAGKLKGDAQDTVKSSQPANPPPTPTPTPPKTGPG